MEHDVSIEKAIKLQRELATKVVERDAFERCSFVGGMDVSNNLYDPEKLIFASCIVCDRQNKKVVEKSSTHLVQHFPYVTGLLAFREVPALVQAYEKLKIKPDIIMVDGHGICHMRGLGIASHIGVMLDIPTIGVGKTMLVGTAQGSLGNEVGSHVPIIYKEKQVAMLVRTKKNANPLIISTGHKVSLESALKLVLGMSSGYRLPEPTRQAHIAANEARVMHRLTA